MSLQFRKMHGLGNDFIVFDARTNPISLTAGDVMAMCDRHTGIGADTVVVIGPARDGADAVMTFHNADGGIINTCGNATRCVAALIFAESGRDRVRLLSGGGLLECWKSGDEIAVDMGPPGLGWKDIPLSQDVDTLHLPLKGEMADPVGVSMGNPHAVFFVRDADAVNLTEFGPVIEHAPLFPERTNVEVAQILSSSRIRMRVWERGVGITQACGSGACATLVAAARRGLTGRTARILLDGGELTIEWTKDDHVIMTGPAATAFTGTIDKTLLPARTKKPAQAA